MPERRTLTAICLLLATVIPGCEQEEGPPDHARRSARRARPVCPPDPTKTATIHADHVFSVPNLIFVVRRDPVAQDRMGVTLKSSEPGSDGSRLVFGSREPQQPLEELAGTSIDMTTSPVLDQKGIGIFTGVAGYQPKFASMKITSFSTEVVRGSISGEFYKFDFQRVSADPPVLKVELQFTARLLLDAEEVEGA